MRLRNPPIDVKKYQQSSRSPSPSTEEEADNEAETDDEVDILAEAVADIMAEAEAKSNGSPGYIMTDLKDDRLHSYAMPVLLGLNLFLCISLYDGLVCPVYTNLKAHGWIEADTRAHVLVRAHAPLDGTYTNDKNVARHCALARNQGWMA